MLEEGKQIFYNTPRKVGKNLADNDLFLAMPSPVQIYNGAGQEGICPLTVCEGRKWLEEHYGQKSDISKEETESSEEEKKRRGDNFWQKRRKEKPERECIIDVREVWF